jgi:FkbM family methyltransferase
MNLADVSHVQAALHATLPAAVPAPAQSTPAWSLRTASGLTLYVPDSFQALSTFVLLEQERWFEPEMSLLPHLLAPGMHALDIGANHGVYTLEMASCAARADGGSGASADGHIWAFEPTRTPRARLERSVLANGVQHRVTVVPAGLSDAVAEVSFAVHANSELNSREGESTERETVQLDTLDNFIARQGITQSIGFIKLDAEGEELRVMGGAKQFFAEQSPVVMFEFKHGFDVNTALIGAWLNLGYNTFRWSAELELLLPFDADKDEIACALNLVAVRPAQQRELAARGLLATAEDLASATRPALDASSLVAWCAQPALHDSVREVLDALSANASKSAGTQAGIETAALLGEEAAIQASIQATAKLLYAQVVAAAGEGYAQALNAVASAHFQIGLSPAQRVLLVRWARESLLASANSSTATASQFGPEAVALVAHCLHALGQQGAAVAMLRQMLGCWPKHMGESGMPFVVPPQRADLGRVRSASVTSWLRQMLGEFVVTGAAYSSYFSATEPRFLVELLAHPDHSAEIERRYLLSHVRGNRSAPVHGLRLLPHPQHTSNPELWQNLVQMMRPQAA